MISARSIRAAAKQALAVNAKIVPRIVCIASTTRYPSMALKRPIELELNYNIWVYGFILITCLYYN